MNGHEKASGHTPVLVEETLQLLDVQPSNICVDATVGCGGHAGAILSKLGPRGRLIAIDRDINMINHARKLLGADKRVSFYCANYDDIDDVVAEGLSDHADNRLAGLADAPASGADVILADLGTSSAQIDNGERGFSFRVEADLDMRMDRSQDLTAADIVARENAENLARIFSEYGQERHARRIARAIVATRKRQPIETTTQLAQLVANSVPGRGRIHPATKVFQSLRIAVNAELESLDSFLATAPRCLSLGGRLAVISFHSLEDRRAKTAFRELEAEGGFERMNRKVVKPSRPEQLSNRRSRSAKLRGLRRIA